MDLVGEGNDSAYLSEIGAVMVNLDDVDVAQSSCSWAQLGLVPNDEQWVSVYLRLAGLVDRMRSTGTITDFFFMHKPPGLRVRFHTDPSQRDALADLLRAQVDAWCNDGLLDAWMNGVYEPEFHLFGGGRSMPHVHRLFTVDSLAWLGFHAIREAGPNWAFSMTLLRSVLDGLEVVGWEDLDVWHRVCRQAGRSLPDGLDPRLVQTAGDAVRRAWTDSENCRGHLRPAALELADRFGLELRDAAADWLSGYFRSGSARIGPREAAAFVTVFHWNRGRLKLSTQMLLASALSDRSARP